MASTTPCSCAPDAPTLPPTHRSAAVARPQVACHRQVGRAIACASGFRFGFEGNTSIRKAGRCVWGDVRAFQAWQLGNRHVGCRVNPKSAPHLTRCPATTAGCRADSYPAPACGRRGLQGGGKGACQVKSARTAADGSWAHLAPDPSMRGTRLKLVAGSGRGVI